VISDVVAAVSIGLGIALILICCAGVLLMDDVFDKLHYLTPASVASPFLIALGILVHESFAVQSLKAMLVAFLFVLTSPILSHATARAARVRQFGHWRALPGERATESEGSEGGIH
jgi:monovalent cation/proton antiporter MnhG/PhaG subunit